MLPFGEECSGLVDVLMCKIKRTQNKNTSKIFLCTSIIYIQDDNNKSEF